MPRTRDTQQARDPARRMRGAPPNFGQAMLPPVLTFRGLITTASRTFLPSDEAIKHSYASARYMLNDCTIRECIEHRMRSTALLDWHVAPEDEKDKLQTKLATEATSLLKKTPRFMQYREALMWALWYGKYAAQHQWQWKRIGDKMRLVLADWQPVNGDKIVYRWDDGSGDCRLDQVGIRIGRVTLGNAGGFFEANTNRLDKVLPTDYGMAYFLDDWERPLLAIHRHRTEDGEWEDPASAGRLKGVGIRHAIYWTWYQRQEALAWLMTYLERCAQGIEIWYYPWGNEEALEKVKTAASEGVGQGRAQIFVPRPMGEEQAYGVDRIEPGFAGAEMLKSVLSDLFGASLKRYILGQVLTTEAASTGLGSNLASVHLDTYLAIVKYDATNLQETLTTDLLQPLIAFNWPQYADVPLRFVVETESPDVEGKLRAWKDAYEMGCRMKERDIMELVGAGVPGDDDRVVQSPQYKTAEEGGGNSENLLGGMAGGPAGLTGGRKPAAGQDGKPQQFSLDPHTISQQFAAALRGQKLRYSRKLNRVVQESTSRQQERFFAAGHGRQIIAFSGDRIIRYRRKGDRVFVEAI